MSARARDTHGSKGCCQAGIIYRATIGGLLEIAGAWWVGGHSTSSHCFQTIYGQKEPFTCQLPHLKMTHPIPDLLFGSELQSFKTKSILLYTF
jgi:hypothetical protein